MMNAPVVVKSSAPINLDRLLHPRSIAVVGGGNFAKNVVQQSLKMGFPGKIWPVHPKRSEIEGIRAHHSVDDLPEAPDAVFIGVNRHLTIDIVRRLAARGAGGAICFAAGFLEADEEGAGLQSELVRAAGNMPVIGPNCYGLINYADGVLLWPDQQGGQRLADGTRGVAIVTQSSNIAINITMQKRGLPVSYIMTAGNQAQTGISQIASNLIEDDRVSVLGLHIEGFDCIAGFERLAQRARTLGKPIVVMKVGRTEQAQMSTISHTASLAGSDAASNAFLERLGIARIDTIPSFLEALKLLHVAGPLTGGRLSSLSCSGGEASVIADAVQGRRVYFPRLTDEQVISVRKTLNPLVTVANPLDYHTFIWNDDAAMAATFTAMVSARFDFNILVLDFPRSDRCCDSDWWSAVDAFERALKTNSAQGALVSSMPENISEDYAARLVARGICPLLGISEALDAMAAAEVIGSAWKQPLPPPLLPAPSNTNTPTEGQARATAPPDRPPGTNVSSHGRRKALTEASAKVLIAARGLSVPPGLEAVGVDEAVWAAGTIGFPVVLKVSGIAHKSEQNAVRLNLLDQQAVRIAAEELLMLGNQFYVERMVVNGVCELIVGITHDPLFGPVMTIGSGGVFVELLQDSVTLLLPVTHEQIDTALRSLKMFPLLDGYRGRPKADVEAAVSAIARIADWIALTRNEIDELDINPLIICAEGEGAWVADALIVPGVSSTSYPIGANRLRVSRTEGDFPCLKS